MKTLIFTATYNEHSNIEKFIKKVFSLNYKLDLLIIDDNSPDKTFEKIVGLKKNFKKLKLIVRKKKEGLDTAHKLAYSYAKKRKYDILITMDADLSHDPKEIPNFLSEIKKNDFVIGSRYMKRGKNKMKIFRLFLSKIGNIIIKFSLKSSLDEFTTSYRAFNLKRLKKFHLKFVKAKGYSFFMETIFILTVNNYKLSQIPITFSDRKKGISKIPRFELFRTLYNVILISLNLKKYWSK